VLETRVWQREHGQVLPFEKASVMVIADSTHERLIGTRVLLVIGAPDLNDAAESVRVLLDLMPHWRVFRQRPVIDSLW